VGVGRSAKISGVISLVTVLPGVLIAGETARQQGTYLQINPSGVIFE
jgi:hypothetical protein